MTIIDIVHTVKVKVEVWTDSEGSRILGSKISRQSVREGSQIVSRTHRPHLPPGNIPGTHFESTPGPECGRKD